MRITGAVDAATLKAPVRRWPVGRLDDPDRVYRHAEGLSVARLAGFRRSCIVTGSAATVAAI
jgi:hypothetical protein